MIRHRYKQNSGYFLPYLYLQKSIWLHSAVPSMRPVLGLWASVGDLTLVYARILSLKHTFCLISMIALECLLDAKCLSYFPMAVKKDMDHGKCIGRKRLFWLIVADGESIVTRPPVWRQVADTVGLNGRRGEAMNFQSLFLVTHFLHQGCPPHPQHAQTVTLLYSMFSNM